MQTTRLSHSTRLTALGLALSLVSISFAPLAHAQQAAPSVAAPKGAAPTAAPKAPAPAAETKPAAPAATPKAAPAATPKAAPAAAPKAAAPAPAGKGPDKKTRDSARKAFADGEKAFNAGDFVSAQAAFEAANALIPAPQAEYWLAKSIDAQPDKLTDAIAAYERFLANPDAGKAGNDKVAEAKTRVEALKAKLPGTLEVVTVPPGASVFIDGAEQPGVTPVVLKLPAGTHKAIVNLTGYEPKELETTVKPNEQTQQKIELTAIPAPVAAAPPPPAPAPEPVTPAPTPPPAAEKRSPIPAFVTLGVAAAGAVVGTVFGLKALSAKSDFKNNPTAEYADDTERNALIADMAFGVAITLGVTGIVLLTTSDDVPETASNGLRPLEASRSPKPTPVKLELDTYAGRTGGGGNLRLTF